MRPLSFGRPRQFLHSKNPSGFPVITLAKSKPGALNFGSAGNGSMSHLGGEMFNALAGINIAHIPYKGTGPAITDLLGGQVQLLFAGGISITPQIKSGRLRVLGQTALKRSTSRRVRIAHA